MFVVYLSFLTNFTSFAIETGNPILISLVDGPCYIFYAHRSVMFTVDRANQWESKH